VVIPNPVALFAHGKWAKKVVAQTGVRDLVLVVAQAGVSAGQFGFFVFVTQ